MKHLTRIIGPAPSELSLEAFILTRLKPERARQERSLAEFRAGAVPSWNKKKKKPAAKRAAPKKKGPTASQLKELQALADQAGMPLKEFLVSLKGAMNE
jgi:hypothetical protein